MEIYDYTVEKRRNQVYESTAILQKKTAVFPGRSFRNF